MKPPRTAVYTPAPRSHRIGHLVRFFFPRRVTKTTPPEDLGLGLRQVVVLECGHSFHTKPKPNDPKRMGCEACAAEWAKRQKWLN